MVTNHCNHDPPALNATIDRILFGLLIIVGKSATPRVRIVIAGLIDNTNQYIFEIVFSNTEIFLGSTIPPLNF